jgi:glutathione S-transferase
MKLYVLPPSPRACKVIALKNHLGLDCEMHIVDLGKGDQLSPEYIALNPNKKMPVLEDDGFVLWESNAILFYLASKKPQSGLWPADVKHQADVLRCSHGKARIGTRRRAARSATKKFRRQCSDSASLTRHSSREENRTLIDLPGC